MIIFAHIMRTSVKAFYGLLAVLAATTVCTESSAQSGGVPSREKTIGLSTSGGASLIDSTISSEQYPADMTPVETGKSTKPSALSSIVESPWFALVSGVASVLGQLLAIWGTQIRTLPHSLYRSFAWRQAMVFSVGAGLCVLSAISFYLQPPPTEIDFLAKLHDALHGFPPTVIVTGHGSTAVWAALFVLGAAFLLISLVYCFRLLPTYLFRLRRLATPRWG